MLDLKLLPFTLLLTLNHLHTVAASPPNEPPQLDAPEAAVLPVIPKPAPVPPKPIVPKPIVPKPIVPIINPPKPVGIGEYIPPAQQTILQSNMQLLEARLDTIQEVLNIGTELISAILATTSSSDSTARPATDTPTRISTPTPASSNAITLNVNLFPACKSYARTLSSCVSATPSFFSLDPTHQASCACYTLSSISTGSCASVPTLVTAAENAEDCRGFFQVNGFSGIASVMDDEGRVEGVGFCSALDEELRAKDGAGLATGTVTRLEETLRPTACTVSREGPTQTVAKAVGAAGRVRCGAADGGVLVSRVETAVMGYADVIQMAFIVFVLHLTIL